MVRQGYTTVQSQTLSPGERHHRSSHYRHKASHALSQSNAAFVQQAIPAAQASEQDSGVPASITLAQACIESGWGHHHIGGANNYFGIKAPIIHGKRNLGPIAIGFVIVATKEYDKNHRLYTIDDAFRQYTSMADSFRDHGIWIRDNSHYPGAVQAYLSSGDADAFARELERGGYAGSNNIVYADSLIAMMKRHAFYQYNAVARKGVST